MIFAVAAFRDQMPMGRLHRFFEPGQIVFSTHVTHRRRHILINNTDLWHYAIASTAAEYPFDVIAWVLLPDHAHILIDTKKTHVSSLFRKIKLRFNACYKKRYALESITIWQPRFWDRIIRDEQELKVKFDYIHFNPVRHGHAGSPGDWEHSSFRRFFKDGYYSEDWGVVSPPEFDGEFGE